MIRSSPRRWQRLRDGLLRGGALRMVAAVGAGVLLYAGFAPSTWWWAPMLGFAVMGVVTHGRSWRVSAGLGLLVGAGLYFPLVSWTNIYIGDTPWVALATAESLLVAPAVALFGPVSRRLPVAPVWAAAAWVTGETLRARFPFGGFAWGTIAFTQPDGPLLPMAAVLGEAAVSFSVALIGLAVGEALRRLGSHVITARRTAPDAGGRTGPPRPATALRAAWLIPVLVGTPLLVSAASIPAVQTGAGAETVPIALVQGNVPQPGLEFNARRRAVLDMHVAETFRLAEAIDAGTVPAPRWVLWPENSSDIDPYRDADAAAVIDAAARAVGVPILVGAVVHTGQPGTVWNMGIVWDPTDGPGQTYIKRRPVPFAEYMPYRDFFRLFSDKVDLVRADFLPGHEPGNLQINGVEVGDVICFEIVEDDVVRDVVRGGGEVLVVQTNNATFGYSNETYQQQAMSRLRAVQYGRQVLISATSGVSAVIRPDGSVESSIPLFTPGFLVAQVPLIDATTPATVVGEPLRIALTAATPLLLLWELLRRRLSTRGPAGRADLLHHTAPATEEDTERARR